MSTTTYSDGTISVGAGSITVTGTGTGWDSAGLDEGDLMTIAGLSVPIATIEDATTITLARGWPGAAQVDAGYDILRMDVAVRMAESWVELMRVLGQGPLMSLAGLTAEADRLPYYIGESAMAAAPLTPFARGLLAGVDPAAVRTALELPGHAAASLPDLTAQVWAQPAISRLEARTMGVLPGVEADNTAALNGSISYAIANGKVLSISGPIRVTDTVRVETNRGRGVSDGLPEHCHIDTGRGTRIVMQADNKPVLHLRGRGIRLGDIQVEFATYQPAAYTNSVGVVFDDLSFGNLGYLDARFCNTGFSTLWDNPAWSIWPTGMTNNFFFDNKIEALRALRYSRRGVVIRPQNEGNTPNRISMISTISPWNSGPSGMGIERFSLGMQLWQQGIGRHVWLNGCRGIDIGKINVESALASHSQLYLDNCPDYNIGVVHMEAVGVSANDAALIAVNNAFGRIGGVSIYDFDLGAAAGLTGGTSLMAVYNRGRIDIDTLEIAANYTSSGTARMIVGQEGGHRIGKWIDNVGGSVTGAGTGTGTTFVEGSGRPRQLYTGSGIGLPMMTHFDGLDILPGFWARAPAGANVTSPGVLPITEVHDTCGCYAAGIFTCPAGAAGLWRFTARLRAAAGQDAVFVMRRNGADTLRRWRHLRSSGADVFTRDNFDPVHVEFYLAAGDTIRVELESGQAAMDSNVFFCGAFVSK
ncbi:hypothetical protein [Pseudogemmobacter sonorensis]|uniref:hypothetical protein n=1 Tax=Pseudogemmobacter sonorensis TaxID=2989681 RepID=UPI0036CFBED4